MPVFQLSVDVSKLKSGANDAVQVLGKVGVEAEKAQSQITKVGTAAQKTERDLISMGKAAVAAFAGFKATQYAKDATLAAARYETLGIVMEQAGKNAGYTAQEMAGFEKALVKSGIAMTESREILARLSSANIDLYKSSQLARAAQDLAVVGGINSSEAFSRMTHGIVSAQSEVLRTIGINVNFEESYKKIAAQLGKTADSLTAQEKMQARVNIVLSEGAKFAGIYAASMETAGKKLTSLPRYFQDISVMAGKVGLEAFGYALDGVTDKAKETRNELERMSKSGELDAIGKDIGSAFKTGVSYVDEFAFALGSYLVLQKAVPAIAGASSSAMQSYAKQILFGNAVVLESAAAERMRTKSLLQTAQAENAAATASVTAAVANKKLAEDQMSRAVSTRQYNVALTNLQGANATLHAAQERLRMSSIGLSSAQARLAETSVLASVGSKTLGASMATGSAVMGGIKTAASGFINFLGGPWVAGLTAAAAAGYALWSSSRETQATMEGLRQQFLSAADGAKGLSEGLNEADATMLRIMRSAAEMKLDKAIEQLKVAQSEAEKFSRAMQIDEWVGGVEIYNVKDQGALEAIRIIKDYRDGIIDAAAAFDRIKEARDKYGRDNKVLQEGEELLQANAAAAKNVADKEKDLGKVNERFQQMNGNIKMAKEQADALAASMEKWSGIDALIKSSAIKGIPQDIKQAIEYSEKFISSSNYGAEAQNRIGVAAQNATRSLFAQAIEAAKVAEEIARAAGNMELAAEMGSRVRGLSSIAQEFEKGVSSGLKKTGGNADSAKRAMEGVNAEIAKFMGLPERGEHILAKKMMEIAKTGKEAGLSLDEVRRKQEEYTAAYKQFEERTRSRSIEEAEINILKLTQGTNSLAASQREAAIAAQQLQDKLVAQGVSPSQAQDIAARTQAAQERAQEVKDLQAASSFMREYAELSGSYGAAVQAQNQVLRVQADIFRRELPDAMRGYVDEWERLKQLEQSRDWFSGFERGTRKWVADSTNAAKQIEDVMTNSYDAAADAFARMAMGQKVSFSDLANSIIADLARIAAKQFIGGIVGKLFGGLGDLIGGNSGGIFGGAYQGGVQSVPRGATYGPSAKGNVFSGGNISSYSGSIVSSPTYFSANNHYKEYATGGGLMGEAGPEGIFPLQRGSDGKLGVLAKIDSSSSKRNSGSPTVIINPMVIDRTQKGVAVQQKQSQDDQGNMRWDIVIDEIDSALANKMSSGNSMIARSIESSYGTDRATQAYRG